MTFRSRTRRVHDMPSGGTCTRLEPDRCTEWSHLTYHATCDCGWELKGKTRASVDYARQTHKHIGGAP